ncbi:uncharacterized protein LOC5514077 isoform X2 [Nematostella vectensis]|uniref:uncharacterized protein LOC5514077 isoform X2 n=1 Tax=Nematostella vectensis TaxID=45351 RepID=UPI00207704AA|nr:uncharacterized protein LOC5514077 isoform X2 [Nematostella vectensis]
MREIILSNVVTVVVLLILIGQSTIYCLQNPLCPSECSQPLGMEDGRIPDYAITTPRAHSQKLDTSRSRLNTRKTTLQQTKFGGAWCTPNNNEGHWLQIDLGSMKIITKVATQGRYDYHQYVKNFTISYSRDLARWSAYSENGEAKIFSGNIDNLSVKENLLLPHVVARGIRFYPKDFYAWKCMRVEVYGCDCARECPDSLGMEDGRIPDRAMTSSSAYSSIHSAPQSRLHGPWSWTAATSSEDQWLQIDLQEMATLTGVATQGQHTYDNWVESYTLSTSDSSTDWVIHRNPDATPKVFQANSDRSTVVTNDLLPNIESRYIRIQPKSWNGHISMRVELYGYKCDCNRTSYVNKDWLFPASAMGFAMTNIPSQSLTAMTACFWYNSSSTSSAQTHVSFFGSQTGVYYGNPFFIMTDTRNGKNNIMVAVLQPVGGVKLEVIAPQSLHSGDWHHICVTWQGTNGTIEVFMDGVKFASDSRSIWIGSLTEDYLVVFGQEQDARGGGFDVYQKFLGRMSRINIWNYTLSQSTIQEMSTKCSTCLEGNLIAWKNVLGKTHSGALILPSSCPLAKGRDCLSLVHQGHKISGYYMLDPRGEGKYFTGLCDQQTNSGGWLVVHRRFDGSVDFYESMSRYRSGFGEAYGEFWLGLEKMSASKQTQMLLVELRNNENDYAYSLYDNAFLEPKSPFRLYLGFAGFQGTAGESLSYLDKKPFKTKDESTELCLITKKTPGWFGRETLCNEATSNLNGEYHHRYSSVTLGYVGMYWQKWQGVTKSLKEASMKIRPRYGDQDYALSFRGSGSEDYILYPKVKGFAEFYVCTFIKSPLRPRRQGLFGMFSGSSFISMSFANNNFFYFGINDAVVTIDLPSPVISETEWNQICFTWSSANGSWAFSVNGPTLKQGQAFKAGTKIPDGALMIGQIPDQQGKPIAQGAFEGSLTLFDVNAKWLSSGRAGGCEDGATSLLSWYHAHLWVHGDVRKTTVFMCDSHKVQHQWRLKRDGSKNIEYIGTKGAHIVQTTASRELNSMATDNKQAFDFGSFDETCIEKSSMCNKGFTASLWMKYREYFHSRILSNKMEETRELMDMLQTSMEENSVWIRCYLASTAMKPVSEFHSLCKWGSVTLVIVKVNEYIFGGVLDVPWAARTSGDSIDSPTAFLFSLKGPKGCLPFKIFPKQEFRSEAARFDLKSGPIFGRDDLHLGTLSFSDLGQVYNLSGVTCPGLASPMSRDDTRKLLAGTYYFVPDEIEIFCYAGKSEGGTRAYLGEQQFTSGTNGLMQYTFEKDATVARFVLILIRCCSSSCVNAFYIEYRKDTGDEWITYPNNHQKRIYRYTGLPGETMLKKFELFPPMGPARYVRITATECYPYGQCCLEIQAARETGNVLPSYILASRVPSRFGFALYHTKAKGKPGVYIFMTQSWNNTLFVTVPATETPYMWNHVVLFYSSTKVILYLNGKPHDLFWREVTTGAISHDAHLRIGGDGSVEDNDYLITLPALQVLCLRFYDSPVPYQQLQMLSERDVFRPAEVQNVALQTATQPSNNDAASKVISGSRLVDNTDTQCSRTWTVANSWWKVTLNSALLISDVFIVVPKQADLRPENIVIKISEDNVDSNAKQCGGIHYMKDEFRKRFFCDPPILGKYVSIHQAPMARLYLCAVELQALKPPGYMFIKNTLSTDGPVRYSTDYVTPRKTCLSFVYQLKGVYPGHLNVYSSGFKGQETLLWRLAGNRGDGWNRGQVPVKKDIPFRVIFEGLEGGRFDGEIAFDNISLTSDNNCTLEPEDAVLRLAGIQSRMIDHLPESRDQIERMLSDAGFGWRYWLPCYRALEHGWDAEVFHTKCDLKGPLLAIARKYSHVFGAFFDTGINDTGASNNLAEGRPTTSSTSVSEHSPKLAVDGSIDSFFSTADADPSPWFKVELFTEFLVHRIFIRNRMDCCRERLEGFEIRIGSDVDHFNNPRCGGLRTMNQIESATFYCAPPLLGRYVSVSKNTPQLHFSTINVFGYPPMPSQRAFIFAPSQNIPEAYQLKLGIKDNMTHVAAFYSKSGLWYGMGDLTIDLNKKVVMSSLGHSYQEEINNSESSILGESSNAYNVSDVEVLFLGDSMCDPLCLKGEYCDEHLGKCVCDERQRDVEMCAKRRELQERLDDFCLSNVMNYTTYARYDRDLSRETKKWHCYSEESLTGDRRRYNISKQSTLYHTRNKLDEISDEYPELALDRILQRASAYWPLDDPNDIRVYHLGSAWGHASAAKRIKGINNYALSFNGTGDPLWLLNNPIGPESKQNVKCFTNIKTCTSGLNVLFWLRYRQKPGQVFFSTMSGASDRGIRVYQTTEVGQPHVAVSLKYATKSMSYAFATEESIWTHIAVTYHISDDVKIYRNGKQVTSFLLENIIEEFVSNISPSPVTIGEVGSGLPDADLDEIILLTGEILDSTMISNIYRYYQGKPNLYINSSIVHNGRAWDVELLYRNSTEFQRFSRQLNGVVASVYTNTSVIKKSEITSTWNKGGKLAFQFLVRYRISSYSSVEPWFKKLKSLSIFDVTSVVNDVYMTPLNVTAVNHTATASANLSVSWLPDQSRELVHGIFAGYHVTYENTADSNDSGIVMLENGMVSFVLELTGLRTYSEYKVTVRADTLEGDGAPCVTYVHTDDGAPLEAPSAFAGHNISSTAIRLSWNPIPQQSLQGPLLEYRVLVQSLNGTAVNHTFSPNSTSEDLDSLTKFHEYRFEIFGISIRGKHGPSAVIHVKTDEDVPVAAPSNVHGRALNSTALFVQWHVVPVAHVLGVFTGYEIVYRTSDGRREGRLAVQGLYTDITGLPKFTIYDVMVSVCNSKGCGPSGNVTLRTDEDRPTAAPSIKEGYNTSSSSLVLRWTSIPSHEINGVLTGYLVKFAPKPYTNDVTAGHIVVTCPELNLTGLDKGQPYEFHVAATTSVGYGPWSESVVVTTDADKPEGVVRNCTFSNVTEPHSVTFELQPLTKEESNGRILGYTLYIYDKLRNETSVETVNGSTSHTLTGLSPYTDYEVRIAAFTAKGEGNLSKPYEVKTGESAPSKPPRNITGQNASSTSLVINWATVDELFVNGRVRAYTVIYWESAKPETTKNITVWLQTSQRRRRAITSDGSSIQIDGLKKYTQYSVQVLAVTVDSGVPSLAFNITTGEDVPDLPPSNLTAYNTSSTTIKVNWGSVPQGAQNGVILGYKVFYRHIDKLSEYYNISVVSAPEMSLTVLGLKKYGLYEVKALAFTIKGDGNLSSPVTCRTEEDAPDGRPVNITTDKGTGLTNLAVTWAPMTTELENGIILGYHVNVYDMSGVFKRNATAHGGGTHSIEIGGLEIWTNYTVSVCAFTKIANGPWSPRYMGTTDEQEPTDVPSNLTAVAINSTSIHVQWSGINTSLTRGIHRGYRIYYQASGTPFPTPLLNVTVGERETEVFLEDLYKFVWYTIYVVAFTNKEGLRSKVIEVRTDEDTPDRPPIDLQFALPSPTSLDVMWSPVPRGYENGVILGYKITCSAGNHTISKDLYFMNTIARIEGVASFTVYNVTIRAYTGKGDGTAYSKTVLTDENNPCRTPQQFQAENYTSTSTLPVHWDPVPSYCVPGILRGYRVRYQPVSTGDVTIKKNVATMEVVVGPTEQSVVLRNLEIYTRYRIQVAGFTVKGDGPFANTFGETCRCNKRLSTSWAALQPYVNRSTSGSISGIIPHFLENMAVACCTSCKSHGHSYVDFHQNGRNESSHVKSESALRAVIDGSTDLVFPIAGYHLQEEYKTAHGYTSLVQSPGVVFILSINQKNEVASQSVFNAVTENWPLVLICLLSAYILGVLMWCLDSGNKEFPRSFIRGSMEGFWWSYVSMTTVGYGDRCPASVPARILSIIWMLSGVVLMGILVGSIATNLSSISMNQASTIYGLRVAAIKNSFEYRFGVRRNAITDVGREYETYDEIYKDLASGYVEAALIDALAASSRKDLFEKPFIRFHKIYDMSFVRGVVSSGDAKKLTKCFHRYALSHAQDVTDLVRNTVKPLENLLVHNIRRFYKL